MKKITAERLALGWSQQRLARETCMASTSVNQIESGRLVAYPGQLTKLAAALKWTGDPADLLEEVGEE